jgi:hypothetical protein
MAETVITYIYGLSDPRDNAVRYVGKTVAPLATRLGRHLTYAVTRRDKTYRSHWIRSLIEAGHKPVIFLIEAAGEDWVERERFWIARYREIDARLTNHAIGGQGPSGFKRPLEQCEAIRVFRLGKRVHLWSEESRAKLSATTSGRKRGPMSDEQKAKISATLAGRPVTEEVITRLVKANAGRAVTERQLAARRAPRPHRRGSHQSPESIAKQKATKEAWTPEQRTALSAAIKAGMRRKKKIDT